MIERYSRKEMAEVFSEEAKFDLWLKIELLVCKSYAKRGDIGKASFENIKRKAAYDKKRIAEIEADVGHDVIAFLTSVAEKVGPDSRFIHMGMTSSDLVDTALAATLAKAGNVLIEDIQKLLRALKNKALEYKNLPAMGRTHGVFAEPIAFGLKFAVWYAEFERHLKRLLSAIDEISVGKLSGAVGTYAHISPEIEAEVMRELNLKAVPVATQVIQRDRHAHLFFVLAGIASSIEKVATEIRNLARSEVFEAAEPFGKKQKGSSAMPHKRNPILCENVCGLARVLRGNAQAAIENVTLWHERDISHSSAERIIAPDSFILLDFMFARITGVIENLDVFPDNIKKNIDKSLGLFASQDVMLLLVKKGMSRESAYKIVQTTAKKAWDGERRFIEVLLESKEVASLLDKKELSQLFDVKKHLRHVDDIYKRVFAKE